MSDSSSSHEVEIKKTKESTPSSTAVQGPVCVTGATGFVAQHLVHQLLKRGYVVHGTARSLKPEKIDYLTKLEEGTKGKLKMFQGDLLEEGSFKDAIEGCTVVFHTASPYTMQVSDPQKELVEPAVRGTLSVLETCKTIQSVTQVIITSSMAAVSDDNKGRLDETVWNTKSSLHRNPYYYSKLLAEKEAWRFMEEEKVSFKLNVINPVLVIGPQFGGGLNQSNKVILDLLNGGFPALMNLYWGIVDVRDVALAHIAAMENPLKKKAIEGRFLCVNKGMKMNEMVNVIAKLLKEEFPNKKAISLPSMSMEGSFGTGLLKFAANFYDQSTKTYLQSNLGNKPEFVNDKIKNELGIKFTPVEETVKDLLHYFDEQNHVKAWTS